MTFYDIYKCDGCHEVFYAAGDTDTGEGRILFGRCTCPKQDTHLWGAASPEEVTACLKIRDAHCIKIK